ncbi:MAG: ribonuclease III [Clostridia bacterium]|nr:ribonuclease III [Clostridia bacterium]
MEKTNNSPLPIRGLEEKIGYKYDNIELLVTAMTHSSYCNESKHGKDRPKDNERLEFLGDSVLSVIVSDYIFKQYGDLDEGRLTKSRALSVCEDTLYDIAIKLGLGDYMLFGHGESTTRGRLRKSILADAFEALLASIYLDGGLEKAREFLLPKIVPIIDKAAKGWDTDYKSRLQKLVQQVPEEVLEYKLVSEVGPPHDRIFNTEVYLNSNLLGCGSGRTKREAEQQAAKKALGFFGEEDVE